MKKASVVLAGTRLVCLFALMIAPLSASAQQPEWNQASLVSGVSAGRIVVDQPLLEDVKMAFDLMDATLVSLDVPETPGSSFVTHVPIGGELLTLDLAPHSVLSSKYRLLVQIEDGSMVEGTPGPIRTLRGVVAESTESVVAGSLLETGLLALIDLPTGQRYWVEPVASKFDGVERDIHVLYRGEDIIPASGTCETEGPGQPVVASPRGLACGTGLCFAELANDADFEYFQDYGSVAAVESRIQSVVNTMNVEYERDVDITHVISAIVVRTVNATDPYTNTDSLGLVTQLRNEWEANLSNIPRDITQLFTGKEIDGSTIGRAFNIGVVCTDQAYSFSQSDCCGSFGCTTDLHAHENGHVWNGIHCNPCGTTMHTPLQCANVMSAGTISRMESHRDSRNCLATSGAITLPFFDDFPTGTLDSDNWRDISGALSNGDGDGEPSASNSLNIGGNASISSNFMDTSGAVNGSISYWWQRTGSGNSPEPGEDLFVEYLDNTNNWILLTSHPGAGPDNDPFEFVSLAMPAEAKHPFFRLRFRGVATNGQQFDDFFVDDVLVDTGDITPPAPDPMTFSIAPTATSTSDVNMEATLATDAASGPVEYMFQKQNGPGFGNSSWQASRTFDVSLPSANTLYTFKVKSRDSAPVPNETEFSALETVYTLIEPPTTLTIGQVTGSSIEVTVDGAFTNLSLLSSGLFLEMTPAGGSGANVWTTNSSNTTITVTGLAVDTEYTFRIKARNQLGVETAFSSSANATTDDVAVPGAPILSNAAETTMDLDIDPAGNDPIAEFAIQCVSTSPVDATWDGQYVTHATGLPAGSEDWQTDGSTINLQNLQPGTQYTFQVKARNPAMTETAFGPSASLTTTTLETPGAPTLSNPSTTTLDLEIDENGNQPTTEYAVQCLGTVPLDPNWDGQYVEHATGNPTGAEDWQVENGTLSLQGLLPDTFYAFQVKARNPQLVETAFGPSTQEATLALVPGAPILGNATIDSLDVDVVPDADAGLDNQADTVYAIVCSSTLPADPTWSGQFVDAAGNPSAIEVWQTDATWATITAIGLQLDTEYTFAVKARNRAGVETALGATSAASTQPDCNTNGIGDLTDIATCAGDPECDDCNMNNIPDGCDIGRVNQWASSVIDVSSEYDESPPGWLAIQALGVPDVFVYGDNSFAWAPLNRNDGLQHITLEYPQSIFADGVTIRENLGNGFVVQVDVVRDDDDSLVEVWPLATGETDPSTPGTLAEFVVTWPQTAFLVKGVRVTIDTDLDTAEWEEIDAVQLRGGLPGSSADANGNFVPDECETLVLPAAPVLTNPTTASMDVSIGADSNPVTTEYAVRCLSTSPADGTWNGQYLDAAGNPTASEVWQTAAAWGTTTTAGMQPDTSYEFEVNARDPSMIESGFGPSATLATITLPTGACCLADGSCSEGTEADCGTAGGTYSGNGTSCTPNVCLQPPVALALSNPTTTSLDVAIGADGNPATTEYAIRCLSSLPVDGTWDGQYLDATGNPSATEVWQTAAAWGTTTTIGMQPDTLYTLEAKARDLAMTETTFGPSAALSTIAIGACCFADGSCNEETEADCGTAGGTYSGNGTSCTPNVCLQPPVALVLSNPTTTSLDVAIGADGNPASTEYAIRCLSSAPVDGAWDGQYLDAAGNPSAAEVWQTAAAWGTTTTIGMQPDTLYTFEAKARDLAMTETTFGPTAALSTIPLPTGACCFGDGSCTEGTEADCGTSGGTYSGDGTGCTPNLCPQPCSLLGDIDASGFLDGNDVGGFVRAKLGMPPEPGEDQSCADFGNGDVGLDTADFVTALLSQ